MHSPYEAPFEKKRECSSDAPIGIFDSGLGGISVLKSAAALLPKEDFLYYGDSLHAPYGTRSREEVLALTEHSAEYLLSKGCKAIVIACNTATGAAAAVLREKYKTLALPIIGIEPAVKPALAYENAGADEGEGKGKILVLATPLTLREEKYRHLLQSCGGEERIYSLPCPGIPELVEQGILGGEQLDALLQKLLAPVRKGKLHFSCAVLGCTHYPFVKESIKQAIGYPLPIIDGAEGTARELARRLAAAGLLCGERERMGQVVFENSDPSKLPLSEHLYRVPI